MKVLFVTRGFPSDKDPMSGNYEAVQVKALVAKGCQVSVLAIHKKPFCFSFFNRKKISFQKVDGVNVYENYYPSFSVRVVRMINKYMKKRAYRYAFENYVKEEGIPDIVHAHIIAVANSISFVKDKYHLPFVITEHWTKTNVDNIPQWLRSSSRTYYKADKVICVSQALADSLKRNFQIESIVINNIL